MWCKRHPILTWRMLPSIIRSLRCLLVSCFSLIGVITRLLLKNRWTYLLCFFRCCSFSWLIALFSISLSSSNIRFDSAFNVCIFSEELECEFTSSRSYALLSSRVKNSVSFMVLRISTILYMTCKSRSTAWSISPMRRLGGFSSWLGESWRTYSGFDTLSCSKWALVETTVLRALRVLYWLFYGEVNSLWPHRIL